MILFLLISSSCHKIDLKPPQNQIVHSGNETIQKFFNTANVNDPLIDSIAEKIYRQEQQNPFVEKFVKYAGFPLWDKNVISDFKPASIDSLSRGKKGEAKVIFIPLALANDSTVNAILRVNITAHDTTFKMLYRWQYKKYGYAKNDKNNNARKTALLFMGMESYAFDHSAFRIRDTLLFKDGGISDIIKIKLFNKSLESGKLQRVGIEICYQIECVPTYYARPSSTYYCAYCETYYTWIDDGTNGVPGDGGGGTGDSPPSDPGVSGGAPDNGGGWADNPCNPLAGPGTRVKDPCGDDPAWEPLPELEDLDYEISFNIIQNLKNPFTDDPIEFYLLAKYKSSNTLKLTKFAQGGNTFTVGDYMLTPNYDKNNKLLFYSASRPNNIPFLGIEYLIKADALQSFKDKIWLYTHAANMFYINGIPNEAQLQLATGDYLKGLATMWSDALTDPYYLVYLGNVFVCGAAGNSLKFVEVRNAAGEVVPLTAYENTAVLYENITNSGSRVNFKVGMKVADFKLELSKATGKNWEINNASNPRIEILYYEDLKYNFRDISSSGSPFTVDVFKNGKYIMEYRFDN